MDALPGGRLSEYRILSEAGRGAMSIVYKGLDTRMGRHVALKVMSGSGHLTAAQREDLLARLRREARAIARLSHPNIVTIYDVGEQDGQPFLVMEYLAGETLRARLDRGPLSPDEASHVLRQVAAGLDAVHAGGIVHRDIKPANVMLLPDGRAVLMDFGVARGLDDTMLTQTGMMVGSPAYMAPEQVEGADAAPASDRWALGVLLYEMLSGSTPFTGKNIPLVMYQVSHEKPRPLPNASSRVWAVLSRALEKNPERRYESGQRLADEFAAAIGSPATRAVRRPRAAAPPPRARAGAWLAGLLLLGALGAGALHLGTRYAQMSNGIPPTAAPARAPLRAVAALPAERHSPHAASRPVVRVAASRQVRALRRHRRARTARVARALSAPVIVEVPVTPRRTRPAHVRPLPRRLPPRVAASPAVSPAAALSPSPSALLGTWHGWQGIHSHDPATLTITRQQGSRFGGVMTVHTPEHATVRVALAGSVGAGGEVSMRETRILSSSRPRAWDLGAKSGRLAGGGMSGVDHDVRGRTARWSFSR